MNRRLLRDGAGLIIILLGISAGIVMVTACGDASRSNVTKPETRSPAKKAEAPVIRYVYNDKAAAPSHLGDGTVIPETPGITIELLRLVSKKTGIAISFRRFPWNRALYMLRAGDADATFRSSFKKERLEFGVYPMTEDGMPDSSRRLSVLNYSLYKLRESPLLWDGKTISHADRAIGVDRGAAIGNDLKKMGIPVEETADTRANFEKLMSKRIAAYAQLEQMADSLLAAHPEDYKDIIKISPPLKTKDYYVMFSTHFYNRHPEIAENVWNTIREIKSSGDYKIIVQKYATPPVP